MFTEALHPGTRVAILKLGATETDIAKMIAAGDLTSPQRFENITFFNIRITGTGTAYRNALDEWAYRPPEHYLTQDFLDRCNGLPVVWLHPAKGSLDSKEFAKRIIGTVVLPYIDGDEVWGIARIYDEEAADEMERKQLSTSPSVVFKPMDGNQSLELSNGKTILIEGRPSLLDHVAICEEGVWDKGGPAAGVISDTVKERVMADDSGGNLDKVLEQVKGLVDSVHARMDRFDDDRRKDAARARFDAFKFSKRRDDDDDDTFRKRHDAEEEACRHDAEEMGETEEMAADKAKGKRKDAEEEEAREAKDDRKRKDDDDNEEEETEEIEKKDRRKDRKARKDDDDDDKRKDDDDDDDDKKRKDARRKDDDDDDDDDDDKKRSDSVKDNERLLRQIRLEREAIERAVRNTPVSMNDKNFDALSDIQARADAAHSLFGLRAAPPMVGESAFSYQVRMLKPMQKHSKTWDGKDLSRLPEDVLQIAVEGIYADAATAARNPDGVAVGTLREITKTDATGRRITEFVGEPIAWMGQFRTVPRAIARPYFSRDRRQSA